MLSPPKVFLLVIYFLVGFVKAKEITCPCGSTGLNFTTFTFSEIDDDSFCSQFRSCATCLGYFNECVSCPPNQFGPYCSNELSTEHSSLHARYKRSRCPNLAGPQSGSIRCWYGPRDSHCTARCLPGHTFANQAAEEIILRCVNNRWTPRNSFPPCISQGYCKLEMNGAGNYNCTTSIHGTHCDIRCISHPRSTRRYACFPGREWQPALPHCIRSKDVYVIAPLCDDPGQVNDAIRMDNVGNSPRGGPYQEGSRLTYRCSNGYTTIGNSVLHCLPSGQWSDAPPVCRRITTTTTTTTTARPQERTSTCRDPGFVSDGERYYADGSRATRRRIIQEGTSIVFSCNIGFALHGNSMVTCLSSGRWSNNLPQCRSITTTTSTTTTTTTTVRPQERTSSCRDPGFIRNGKRLYTDGMRATRRQTFHEGTFLVFSCKIDFALHGSSMISCLSPGRWSNNLPQCKSITTTSTTTTTDEPSFCKVPLKVANGEKTIVYPINERRRPLSGESKEELLSEGIQVHYTCHPGYDLDGSDTLTCLENGVLSSDIPKCIEALVEMSYCKIPKVTNGKKTIVYPINERRRPENTELDEEQIPEEASVQYTCEKGYVLQGRDSVMCLENGRWSSEFPICVEGYDDYDEDDYAYCKDPGTDPNGSRLASPFIDARKFQSNKEEPMFVQGEEIEFFCNEGYKLQGQETILCLFTGEWSGPRPTCQSVKFSALRRRQRAAPEVFCDDPGYVTNSRRVVHKFPRLDDAEYDDEDIVFPEGMVLGYICDDGFEPAGKANLTCLEDGTWNSKLPECHSGCGVNFISSTNRITNGRMTSSGDWPWQVGIASVQRNNYAQIFCGGALVDANTVITAAHCLPGKRIHRTRLYFGKYYFQVSKDDDNVEVRRPTEFIMHPQFNAATFDNDIAIIHFLPEIRITERIHPICLPTRQSTSRNLVPGNHGYIVGWGLTEMNLHPDSLMMAKVPIVSTKDCIAAYKQSYQVSPITNNMFCAGYQEGKIDSCSGDSGGPMSFLDPQTKKFVLEGLVSFGPEKGCGLPKLYGVYTKVSKMVRWIKSRM